MRIDVFTLVPHAYAWLTEQRRLSMEELGILKRKFGLSMQAWARRAKDLDIIDEVSAYLQDRYDEFVASGLSAPEAHRLTLAHLDTDAFAPSATRCIPAAPVLTAVRITLPPGAEILPPTSIADAVSIRSAPKPPV